MKSAVLTLTLCLSSSASIAQPDTSSANYHLPSCKAIVDERDMHDFGDAFRQGVCSGIVKSVFSLGDDLPGKYKSCAPGNATMGQATQIVVLYLEGNPQRLHESFVDLAAEALGFAWPCKQ